MRSNKHIRILLSFSNLTTRKNIRKKRFQSTGIQRNFYKNALNYSRILSSLTSQLKPFSSAGILSNVNVTAPAFNDLPSTDDSDAITIKNAWSADHVNHLRIAHITGSLYIEA